MISNSVDLTKIVNIRNARHGFDEVDKLVLKRDKAAEENLEGAMRKFQEAQHANDQSTIRMVDRHIELVRKSQALNRERIRKEAIERQALERKEEHSEILAQMAIRKAERTDLLKETVEAARQKRQKPTIVIAICISVYHETK